MIMWRRRSPTLVMRSTKDDGGTMYRAARLRHGALSIVGHDVGPAVEQLLGCREYEFSRTLSATETDRLRELLGVTQPNGLLPALKQRFSETHEIEQFVQANGIGGTFWARRGG